jgi:hypothetical protein
LRLAFEPRRRRPPFVRKLQARVERLWYRRSALLERHGIAARSESAEAIALVVKALLLEWDQITSRVGWRRGEGYLKGVPIKKLARWTGLNVGRVVRAVCALMHAGLLQGKQPREQLEDGRWVGLPKVRRISWRLFYLVGVQENELRQAAAAAAERRARPPAPASSGPANRLGDPEPAGQVLAELEIGRAARLERIAAAERERGPPGK